jgi:hypothetical protein
VNIRHATHCPTAAAAASGQLLLQLLLMPGLLSAGLQQVPLLLLLILLRILLLLQLSQPAMQSPSLHPVVLSQGELQGILPGSPLCSMQSSLV